VTRRNGRGRLPHQNPYKRTNPSGSVIWVARYFDLGGRPRYAKPRWNGGKASFARRRDAQLAIDEALERLGGLSPDQREKIGEYFCGWVERHPRSARTNKTNSNRISRVLSVELDGRPLCEWEFDELRRRQVLALVDHMLRTEGRAMQGVRGILSSLSAMAEDAIGDDVAEANPFRGMRLRRNDPRIQKPPRRIRVWSFEQIRAFAAAGRPEVRARTPKPRDRRSRGRYKVKQRFYPPHDYEALLLTLGLTGLRLGEVLTLVRRDPSNGKLTISCTAHEGELIESSEQKNHNRVVPAPPSLARFLESLPVSADTDLFFPTPDGKLWREGNFYREVWLPAQLASGLDPTPHEFRHSYVTHLQAAGVDRADLAKVTGHSLATLDLYTHALERSHEQIKEMIG